MRAMRMVGWLAVCLLAAACNKEKDVAPPAELVEFRPTLRVERIWAASTRGGEEVLRLGLRPAIADGRAYVAGHGGDLQALELATGRSLWRVTTEFQFAGGPAAGDGLVAVGTTDGELAAFDAGNGALRWRVATGGEVLAAPAIGGGLVVVRTVDGRLRGLSVQDGSEAWHYEQPVPRLTLRGNGAPVIHADQVLAGFDNGKVIALALASGELLWTATVAAPQGRTEIERLVDIDSAVRISGEDAYVVGYQGRVAMLALESGQIWWGRDLSSHRGLALGEDRLYVTTADSTIVALRRRDGTEVWRQEQMLRRGLTAPALVGDSILVADFEGYLHWLDAATGELISRERAGRGRIGNAPAVADGIAVLQTDAGEVQAWRVRPAAG